MNYIKIQKKILNDAYARDTKLKKFSYRYGETDEIIGITPDGHIMYFIPKEMLYINIEMIFKEIAPVKLNCFIDSQKDQKDVIMTNQIEIIDNKVQVRLFKTAEDSKDIRIDEKLLKEFDIKNSTFKGINGKSPLFIYENDYEGEHLVGVILPVVKADGENPMENKD